jgi:hypothetical protein
MRKVHAAAALGAVAIVAIFAASGAAAQGPIKVRGKASVFPTPVNTLDSKGKSKTTSIQVIGKLKTRAACLAGRTIQFIEVSPAGSFVLNATVKTTGKGAFTATLPFNATGLTSKANGTAITVSATATQVTRTDKKTGDKVKCLGASGINDFAASV